MGLRNLVPEELKVELGTMLPQGYHLASMVMENIDFLKGPIGQQALPYLRLPAISYMAMKLQGKVHGLEVRAAKNKPGNYSFVELEIENLIITINHQGMVNGELAPFPRPAEFRDQRAQYNEVVQTVLWEGKERPFFGKAPMSAVLWHSGRLQPESAELIVYDATGEGILDRLPIPLNPLQASDVEKIPAYMPEFKKFMEEKGGDA